MANKRATPWTARLLLGLGLASSAMLVAAGLIDLGDPGAAILEGLEREATSHGRLIQQSWEARRRSQAPVAAASDVAAALVEGKVSRRPPLALKAGDEENSLRLVGARSNLARGAIAAAERVLLDVVAGSGASSGEALLILTTTEELRNETLRRFEELSESVPWDASASTTESDTSARLIALLSAAPDLEPDARERLADSLEAALLEGAVALPEPLDSAGVTAAAGEAQFHFQGDPWWYALRARVERHLSFPSRDRENRWPRAFQLDERRQLALGRMSGAILGPGLDPSADSDWQLVRITDDAWLGRRTSTADPSQVQIALHPSAALQSMARELTVATGDLVPFVSHDGEAPPELERIAEAGALAGTDLHLAIHHPDPARLAQSARKRLAFVRIGLFALAALILAITALAARLIQRARGLQNLRTTFVASVSHDLRTPLASIGLMAESLRAGYAKGREAHYGAKIERETHRLGRLIDDLLDFGRIERGLPPSVRRRDVSLGPWLESFAERERDRCAARGCALSLTLGAGLGSALIDTDALERAVGNLIDNALKHGGAESIQLLVERADGGKVLRIAVEDQGRGLPAGSVSERLFEPFERRSDVSGTGLGLTIVRAILQAHGGTATLSAGPNGRGARAILTLPVAKESAA